MCFLGVVNLRSHINMKCGKKHQEETQDVYKESFMSSELFKMSSGVAIECVCVCVGACAHACVCLCVCVHACMHVCMSVCLCQWEVRISFYRFNFQPLKKNI